MMTVIRLAGLILWLSPLAYLLDPAWMAWSKMGLPEWARWLGVGIGILCVGLIYWLFLSIGSGITPTSATRTNHTLVTSGPYRWIRHPSYTGSLITIGGFGLAAGSWLGAILAVLWMLRARGVRHSVETLGIAVTMPRILAEGPSTADRIRSLPYGVAMAAGALAAAWVPGLLLS